MAIHIALPALNERDYIVKTLECLQKQSIRGFYTWVCVNQPECHHTSPEKKHICENNLQTLQLLKEYPLENLHIIDRSSPGYGWEEGKLGVGYARKTIMDAIAEVASDNDIIVSMDADTVFGPRYLESVENLFRENPKALALANPYYHPLINDEIVDRAVLRYEIYMRYYALNMRLTGTPYCFSPLGSAMAATIKAYKKINGLTPKKSGEDFYFLQKLVKAGKVLMHNTEVVYPGTRLSDRVFFGTGPAMIKGISGQWSAYPLFSPDLFLDVKKTIGLFPELFNTPAPTPLDNFFKLQFGDTDIFEPLRKNNKEVDKFVKACHEKLDGLRILQYLKLNHSPDSHSDEDNLKKFIYQNFNEHSIPFELENVDFSSSPVNSIDKIRNFLFETEILIQKSDAKKNRTHT
jgi:hypothetical protein